MCPEESGGAKQGGAGTLTPPAVAATVREELWSLWGSYR
jgi:hypothetical protein